MKNRNNVFQGNVKGPKQACEVHILQYFVLEFEI
jgi:hypothetical protein